MNEDYNLAFSKICLTGKDVLNNFMSDDNNRNEKNYRTLEEFIDKAIKESCREVYIIKEGSICVD